MKQLRFAWVSQGYRAIFAASLLVSTAALHADGPARATARPLSGRKPLARDSAPSTPTVVTPSSGSDRFEYADALPSPIRPVPADLLLKKDDEKKADALVHFAQGIIAEDSADQDRMLESYRKALELDPSNAELAVKVAFELARRGDVTAAIQVLKDTIKAAPKEAVPYIYLSQLYLKNLNKPDLALKYSEQALALAPENFAAYLAQYEIFVSTGQLKKAEQVLERASKGEHTDPKYWLELGEQYSRLFLKDDGSAEPAQIQKMNAVYLKAAELDPKDTGTLTKVADYFVLSKQVKEAIPFYQKALAQKPEPDDPPLSNLRMKLGRSLMIDGQRPEAIKVLEQIVKDNPLSFETYELLGELYEQSEDMDKALANYEHSLLLDANEPRNHIRLTQLLINVHRYDRAVEIMQAARKRFTDRADVTYILAVALSAAKRYPEALSAFSDAQAEAEISREELLNAGFYFSYGAAAEQSGLYDKAAELLKQSLQLEPNSHETMNYLGYMWIDRGEHLDEAGELIKKAVAMEPERGAYLDSLGWYYYKKGEPERALTELLRAQQNILREEKKEDPVVLEHIGDVYAKLGKNAEALSFWQKSLALDAENKKVAQKIEAAKKVTAGAPTAPTPPQ